jgi:hypothetical protein
MAEQQSADGLEGVLIFTADGPLFRVYSADRKSHTDYTLRVDDLPVKLLSPRYVLVGSELTYRRPSAPSHR